MAQRTPTRPAPSSPEADAAERGRFGQNEDVDAMTFLVTTLQTLFGSPCIPIDAPFLFQDPVRGATWYQAPPPHAKNGSLSIMTCQALRLASVNSHTHHHPRVADEETEARRC